MILSALFNWRAIIALAVLAGALTAHFMAVSRAVAVAEQRLRLELEADFAAKRRADVAAARSAARQDAARRKQTERIIGELANVEGLDPACHVPGDALRLLDAIGERPPSAS